MALYHFSVKQVSRGKGQTVVNSAAYISGQKQYRSCFFSERTGRTVGEKWQRIPLEKA